MDLKKMTSSELDGMVYGMLLGDGCIRKPTKAGTCNLILHHSTKQREYFNHKMKLLELISHVKTNYWERKIYNKKMDKYYYSLYGNTNFLNYFKKLRNIFYDKSTGTKIVSKKILNKLTPLGLALWWQDDGCCYVKRHKNNRVERRAYLATCSFTKEEHELIKDYFDKTWKIKVSVRKHSNKPYHFISFSIEGFEKFKNIIEPYIVPSMLYKIDNNKVKNKKPGPKPKRVGD